MLRVNRLFRAGDARTASTVADAWKEAAYAGFEDTVRRICTQCGWTRASGDTGRMLAIGSAVEGEGKSLLSEAIAIAMASDHSADVLLLECNLLAPTLSRDFGLEAAAGLSDVLLGRADFSSTVRLSRMSNLWLLPAGVCDDNPSRLLRSQEMAALLDEARARFAFTVLDLPATLASSDATVLARLADGMVLVTRGGETDLRAVGQALQLLSGVTIHGVVLNRWRSALPKVVNRLVTL